MGKIILFYTLLFATALLISVSPVRAQNVLWVGPNGSDGNACSQASPCATFQGAINKGSASQINCLGSGFYGTVTITASITIDCGAGNVGNIVTSSTPAISVTTSSASLTVVLRHLAINGLANTTSFDAIQIQIGGGTLIIEDCSIQGFDGGSGIRFIPDVAPNRGLLQVSNSQIFGNLHGIRVEPGPGNIASVTLNRVELVANSSDGLLFGGGGVVAGTMRDSVVGENGNSGVIAGASQVFFTIEESSIVANLVNGIQANSPGSTVNVGASTIGGNGTGVLASSGSIISFGNNQMSVNAVNGTFTSRTALQ